jgi:hypothetical protein
METSCRDSFEYELTLDDMVIYQTGRLMAASITVKTMRMGQIVVAGTGVVIMAIAYSVGLASIALLGTLILFVLGCVFYYPKLFLAAGRKRLAKLLTTEDLSGIVGAHTFTFAPDTFYKAGPKHAGNVTWARLTKLEETSDFIVLHLDKDAYELIPKSIFMRDVEKEAFIDRVAAAYRGVEEA